MYFSLTLSPNLIILDFIPLFWLLQIMPDEQLNPYNFFISYGVFLEHIFLGVESLATVLVLLSYIFILLSKMCCQLIACPIIL